MRRLKTMFVLVAVALWLPATVHCAIDAVGLVAAGPACCEDEAAPVGEVDPCDSRCEFVGDGLQRDGTEAFNLRAPELPLPELIFALAPAVLEPPREIPRLEEQTPPEIKRTWHFAVRAAASPRAPAV